jgi:hypothetical protein
MCGETGIRIFLPVHSFKNIFPIIEYTQTNKDFALDKNESKR